MDRDQIFRNARMIQAALPGGVAMFALVVLFLYHQGPATQAPSANDPLPVLSLFNAIAFPVLWAVGPFVQRLMIQNPRPNPALSGTPEVIAATRWLSARLIVLATREGCAFTGLVACLLGALSGTLARQPLYWLNALPAVALIVYALVTFPTREEFDRATGADPAASIIR